MVAGFSTLVFGQTESLDEITLSNLIYLIAASFLLPQLFSFELHRQVKLSKEATAEFSGYVVG